MLLQEMRTWGESKILSCCFCVWFKSRELGGSGVWKASPQTYFELKHPQHSSPVEVSKDFHTLNISTKKLHPRCLTGLRMCFQMKVLSMWVVGGLHMHGICSRRFLYSEVVEVPSNYKRFYSW